jgi:DNA-binding CsgD family transcriptional regulator
MAKPRRAGRSLAYFKFAGDDFAVVSVPLVVSMPDTLTAAEREVVRLVVTGKSNAQIARARGVAVRTVANQVAAAMRKLGASSRTDLIVKVTRR